MCAQEPMRLQDHQVLLIVSECLQVGLGRLGHRPRATHQREGAIAGREDMRLHHLLGDEAHIEVPNRVFLHAVHCVPQLKALGVRLRQAVQLLAQEDVLRGLVRIDQAHPRRVLRLAQHRGEDLVARGQAGPTGDERDPVAPRRLTSQGEGAGALVDELTERAFHVDRVSDLHGLQMLGHLAALRELRMDSGEVDLNKEVHVTKGGVVGHRRVRPHDRGPVDLGLQQHVRACRQAKPHVLGR
mmetsp:Transcript_9825/g.26483  ORF Transcript_9825/g.26483 Transcript_9825/m.26483 type:complete len:242 (+) Transcript_9825:364-1089(+)